MTEIAEILPRGSLETARLVLRPFRESDFAAYAAYHGNADVYRYLYRPVPTGEALREQFARACAPAFAQDGDVFRLAVLRRDDDALLGEVLVKRTCGAAGQGEIGYVFSPASRGRGYATEAVAILLDLAFDALVLHRVFARLDPRNRGSVGLVERLGLRREAHFRENERDGEGWGDEYVYALLAREWRAIRSAVQPITSRRT